MRVEHLVPSISLSHTSIHYAFEIAGVDDLNLIVVHPEQEELMHTIVSEWPGFPLDFVAFSGLQPNSWFVTGENVMVLSSI